MNENDLITSAFALSDCVEKDPLVLALKQAEADMENSPEIARLAYAFDLAQTHYNDCLKIYSEHSPEISLAQKDLYLKKKALDEHPLTQNYLKHFAKVREMYDHIQATLFAPFNEHLCKKEE